jgi:hypothetical protein
MLLSTLTKTEKLHDLSLITVCLAKLYKAVSKLTFFFPIQFLHRTCEKTANYLEHNLFQKLVRIICIVVADINLS